MYVACIHLQVSSEDAEISEPETLKRANDGFPKSSEALQSLSMDSFQKELIAIRSKGFFYVYQNISA